MRRALLTIACLLMTAPALAAEVPAHISGAIAASERSDKDRERDARDKPAEFLTFVGLQPGMKVADVFGGGGYWSELIFRAVGPQGGVTLVNNPPYWNFAKEDLETRFAKDRLSGITRRVVESCDLKLGQGQFDMILMFMAYHDIYWVNEDGGWPAIDTGHFLDQLHAALKPGGKLLIVDNAAAAGTGKSSVNALHRIEESFAKKEIGSHGFLVEKAWHGYRSSQDDPTKLVFDPAVQGKTDRFTHVYRKR
jgi:predicted methyltransferase